MKVLVTGSNGFIGSNLIVELKNRGYFDLVTIDRNDSWEKVIHQVESLNFIFHLAGVNRPTDPSDFMKGNFDLTSELLALLKKSGNKAPVLLSSSIQANMDNPYGQSKKAGEDILFKYGRENGIDVYVYRFPNVFGKWCRPNYNSAIATFCHNIARDIPITVNDPSVLMNLVYIDDVVNELINAMEGRGNRVGDFYEVPVTHQCQLGHIVDLIHHFKASRGTLGVPNLSNEFEKKLYSTYLSYLPEDQFSYPLKMNSDHRGSFSEFIKTPDRGQFSINVAKPGITKGNHWHHTKNEKFLVVSGKGSIRFRRIDSNQVIEYTVSGDKLEVVDIPVGYTHNIQNIGDTDLVTVMWANEAFDPQHPDTFFLEV
jgi:UDP-2-acetamido-2,6-beta-L-arabino-hexul-4-ose reductase